LSEENAQFSSISVFLDAVNVASVAIIVAIAGKWVTDSILDWRTLLIAITSLRQLWLS
jgi:chromate transporter